MAQRDIKVPVGRLKRQPGLRDLNIDYKTRSAGKQGSSTFDPSQFSLPVVSSTSKKETSLGRLRKSISEFTLTKKAYKEERQDSATIVEQQLISPSFPKNDTSVLRLGKSISEFKFTHRVKQVIGRKRSLEEDGNGGPAKKAARGESARGESVKYTTGRNPRPPLPSTSSFHPTFWEKYKALHVYHNELEALVGATMIAHAYDEHHGLELPRDPPDDNEEALEFLRDLRRQSIPSSTDTSWTGGLENLQSMVGLAPLKSHTPVPLFADTDLTWAGEQVGDFRCYVRAAREPGWHERMTGLWKREGHDDETPF